MATYDFCIVQSNSQVGKPQHKHAASLTVGKAHDIIESIVKGWCEMVKSPANESDWLLPEMVHPSQDWTLSPRAMRRYLQYHLYMIEHRIDQLTQELERRAAPLLLVSLGGETVPADLWEMWSTLNYLLRARDSILQTLRQPRHKLN